ncbi:MAG: hypothetical protein HC920_03990 [Oscillatoriales cyanobacterium SM2_3_0]|nr:hypothetical protein [Oscillatoriales cyanobacterium SM2_3_0]
MKLSEQLVSVCDISSDVEIVKSQVPLNDVLDSGYDEGLDFAFDCHSYYAYVRIVQVQNLGNRIRIILIDGSDSPVKKMIREMYEQGVNWVQWLQQRQARAAEIGYPVMGYYCINHIVQGDSYLGQSWVEACQKLVNAGLMSEG